MRTCRARCCRRGSPEAEGSGGDRIEYGLAAKISVLTVVGMVNDNAQGLQSSRRARCSCRWRRQTRCCTEATRLISSRYASQAHDGPSVEAALATIEKRYRDLSPGMLAAYADKESSLEASKILTILLLRDDGDRGGDRGIGVANTLTLNVLERRREIGVMRAVGGRNGHLVQVFLTEALAMGGAGFLFGVLLAGLSRFSGR